MCLYIFMLVCAVIDRKHLYGYSESGMTKNMSTFDLQLFINNPTLDKFDRCRKDDLLKIADHYGFSVVRKA